MIILIYLLVYLFINLLIYSLFYYEFAYYSSLFLLIILNKYRKGLLTRRQLTNGPEFGITLKETVNLDGFHVIFGIVLQGIEVLDAISLVPTYSYKTKTG